MSKNTTDLREQIYSILNSYSDAIISTDYAPKPNARPKAIERIEALISNREKLARIDEWDYIHEIMHSANIKAQMHVDEMMEDRIATLRKELDGEEPTNE